MKKLVVLAIALTVMLLPVIASAQATQPPKIGYIDLQKVMLESDKGKGAKKTLTDEVEKLKKNLNQKQEEIQKLKDSLEKQGATITPEARAEREKQYQTKLKDYQRMATDFESELRQKDVEASTKILKDLEEVVKKLGDTEKFTLILEKTQSGILFGSQSADITDKVIALYNESNKRTAPAKK
jgi:outer membrane protein